MKENKGKGEGKKKAESQLAFRTIKLTINRELLSRPWIVGLYAHYNSAHYFRIKNETKQIGGGKSYL